MSREGRFVPEGASWGSGDRLGSLSYIALSQHHGGYAGGLIERVSARDSQLPLSAGAIAKAKVTIRNGSVFHTV